MVMDINIPSLHSTLGALQVSLALSLALFGACSIQFYYYLEHQRADNLALRSFVIAVWFFELLHAIVFLHAVYRMNVSGYGSYDFYVMDAPWSLKLLVLFSAILDIAVEGYFAYRIKLLSNRWEIPIVCWLLIAIRTGAAIAQTILSFEKGFVQTTKGYIYVLAVVITPLAIVDFIISVSLLYWLSRIRSGLPSSDQIISRLSVFALECGMLTFFLGVCILATAVTMNGNFIWLAILCVHSKIYSNALLLSLNRREGMDPDKSAGSEVFRGVSEALHLSNSLKNSATRRGSVGESVGDDYPVDFINIISSGRAEPVPQERDTTPEDFTSKAESPTPEIDYKHWDSA